ncbi:hypothetical protein GOP47_0016279 [Adiantum capillus-veneris]|uniref:Uncharacterized protein n=1 Tax=Adiantum capillus-veneris TaxID=13818 RepID=A0A9D4UI78_ADICA|nr:hypothetical protein GOP47_0016279 [Adiantum capillus-veneris]
MYYHEDVLPAHLLNGFIVEELEAYVHDDKMNVSREVRALQVFHARGKKHALQNRGPGSNENLAFPSLLPSSLP